METSALSKRFWERASRSRSSLWKLAIGLLVAGLALGCALHRFHPSGTTDIADRILASVAHARSGEEQKNSDFNSAILPALERELADPAIAFSDVAEALPALAQLLAIPPARQIETAFRRRFSSEQTALFLDFIAAYGSERTRGKEAETRLRALAGRSEPPRFAHYFAGMLDLRQGDPPAAARHFEQEGKNGDAETARSLAIHAWVEAKNFAELSRLETRPEYARLFRAADRLEIAIAKRDWREIFRWVPMSQVSHYKADLLLLTLITAAAWAFFLFHLGETPRMFSGVSALCLAGFVLGALSTTPTVYLVILEDDILRFTPGENLFQTVAYFLGGVGLREELCKLVLFAPLLPWLLKRDDELEALLVASFVGLGFAIEENTNYLLMSHAAAAPGRFLTANFFHVTLTGLNGLALFRAVSGSGRGWSEFLTVLPLTILAHGLYDALPDIPQLGEIGGYLAIAVYLGFVTLYFNAAHELRRNRRATISLTGAFIAAVSTVAASVIVFQIRTLGPIAGLTLIVPEFLSIGVLIFMFLRAFNEGLAD